MRYAYLLAVEVVFLVLITLAGSAWVSVNNDAADALTSSIRQTNQASQEAVRGLASEARYLVLTLLVSSVLLILIAWALWAASRYVFWSWTMRVTLNWKRGFRFAGLILGWNLLWLPLLILVFSPAFVFSEAVRNNPDLIRWYQAAVYLAVAVFLLKLYFGVYAYHHFLRHDHAYNAVTHAFPKAFRHLRDVWFPLTVSVLCMRAAIVLAYLMPFYAGLALVVLVYVGVRQYLIQSVDANVS